MAHETCIVMYCSAEPVIKDEKNHTKWSTAGDVLMGLMRFEGSQREIWYCAEHAKQYLFPLIDKAAGNSEESLIKAFKREGYW